MPSLISYVKCGHCVTTIYCDASLSVPLDNIVGFPDFPERLRIHQDSCIYFLMLCVIHIAPDDHYQIEKKKLVNQNHPLLYAKKLPDHFCRVHDRDSMRVCCCQANLEARPY